MRIIRIFLFLSALSLCAAACSKADTEQAKTRLYVNTFARDYMKSWYLWNKEIGKDLDAWENTEDPVAKVAKIRYKDAKGDDIDRWTMVTDDTGIGNPALSTAEKGRRFADACADGFAKFLKDFAQIKNQKDLFNYVCKESIMKS